MDDEIDCPAEGHQGAAGAERLKGNALTLLLLAGFMLSEINRSIELIS